MRTVGVWKSRSESGNENEGMRVRGCVCAFVCGSESSTEKMKEEGEVERKREELTP